MTSGIGYILFFASVCAMIWYDGKRKEKLYDQVVDSIIYNLLEMTQWELKRFFDLTVKSRQGVYLSLAGEMVGDRWVDRLQLLVYCSLSRRSVGGLTRDIYMPRIDICSRDFPQDYTGSSYFELHDTGFREALRRAVRQHKVSEALTVSGILMHLYTSADKLAATGHS